MAGADDVEGFSNARLVVGLVLAAAAPVVATALSGGSFWFAALSLGGVVATGVAVKVTVRRFREGTECARPGSPETGVEVPVPGAAFDRALGAFEDEGGRYRSYPTRVRTALENAGVSVLGRYRGIPRETARERLASGEWTDDPAAAAFLQGGSLPDSGPLGRVRRSLGRESSFRRGIRHTVAALADLSGARVGDPEAMRVAERESVDRAPPTNGRTAPDGGTDADVVRSTRRWYGIGALALSAVGIGALVRSPAVVLAGAVGTGVGAYARAFRPPDADLSVERSVSVTDPAPGERVEVTLTVHNAGEEVVPDLRVVDGVPAALSVVDGVARTGTALRPGETATLSYAVRARRGVHRFDPPVAVLRDPAGTVERERRIPPDDPDDDGPPGEGGGDRASGDVVTCRPPLVAGRRSLQIAGEAASYAGRVTTAVGGEGVEFHSVREYERSDPVARVDWNRYARTRELSTREFADERATVAVVVVDARRAAYLAPGPTSPHAVDRGVRAAREAFADLESDGNRVGLALVGGSTRWLPPRTGAAHRAQAREALATDPAASPVPPESDGVADPGAWLRSRLPDDTQVVFVSPFCDDRAERTVRRLRAHGYPVTAVSPDPTAADTASRALARVGRRLRLARLRDAGVHVVDWRADEPLAAAVDRSTRRA